MVLALVSVLQFLFSLPIAYQHFAYLAVECLIEEQYKVWAR